MLRVIAIGLGLIVLAAAIATGIALRDNPARPVDGEARFIDHHGTRIQYFVRGPADAATVVLLASYARSASDFNELVKDLNSAGYRTVTLQARGIDGSALPSLRPSLFDYADDLAAVLDAEKRPHPVVLVGHAYGNRIARSFASRYPQRVDSLVLLAAGDSPPPPQTRNAILTVLLQIWPEDSRMRALQKAFFAPDNIAPDYWLRGWYPKAGFAQGYATRNTPPEAWTGGGESPILIVQPDHDAAAAEGAAVLKRRFPHRVTVRELGNAGHAILPEQPSRVSALIRDHLRERRF